MSLPDTILLDRTVAPPRPRTSAEEELRAAIEHAAHFLPSQGPLTVFVHHNTLHHFEGLPFEAGVMTGSRLFGCHPYLPEDNYRQELTGGRIRHTDLEAVLLDDLGEDADGLVASFGTRYALRLAMLQFPLQTGPAAELRWVIAETDASRRFRPDIDPSIRAAMIAQTRRWVMHDLRNGGSTTDASSQDVLAKVIRHFGRRPLESWSESTWEAFVLHFLWRVCHRGVRSADEKHVAAAAHSPAKLQRHRDLLLEATGEDADRLVHDVLIRFCAAFLDQGIAHWKLPNRETGFYSTFLNLYCQRFASPAGWYSELAREARRLLNADIRPLQSIEESLGLLGVGEDERNEFIVHTLLALRGWAGMVWQMETHAKWALHPAPPGSLVEFLAVRLILDRLAADLIARKTWGDGIPLHRLRDAAKSRTRHDSAHRTVRRAFVVFQLAQIRGWKPEDLQHLSPEQWTSLLQEIESFPGPERRRIFQIAYERQYRNATLDALATHSERQRAAGDHNSQDSGGAATFTPAFQVVCCIDEREESFRRHIEEIDPECETLGVAGFYGVAMYYQGIGDAHFKPLCPVVVEPRHYVREQPVYSLEQSSQRQAEARRRLGRATHQAHRGTRTLLGGLLTGFLGSLAAFPLVARILLPRTTARLMRMFDRIVTPQSTELWLERTHPEPSSENGHVGYTTEEMAGIVAGTLKQMGLTNNFARLVLICGHGSTSLNNPHESAYNCGACSGSRGGPNARAFAQMANDPRVRRLLAANGLVVPEDVHFVGAFHNTCDDSVTWFDVDRVPLRHRQLLQRVKRTVDDARARNAHERCRRFESAALEFTPEEALRHVEARAEDLSQVRPEYNHATNALCFVGRRAWSRSLFLDRRAFLASYDPAQDDAHGTVLERLLQAAVPVCAGINLEYYHSTVDVEGYGCGSKLPHNITSLIGVMTGAFSDLRPGLSAQMVEIHEPMRLLMVIETAPKILQRIIDDNPDIARLVDGRWVQLAIFNPETSHIQHYSRGEFMPYRPESHVLPVVESSLAWYRGRRDHLPFASITSNRPLSSASEPGQHS